MYNRCAVFEYNKTRDVWDPRGLSRNCLLHSMVKSLTRLLLLLLLPSLRYTPLPWRSSVRHAAGVLLLQYYYWKAIVCLFSHIRYSIRVVYAFICRPIVDLSEALRTIGRYRCPSSRQCPSTAFNQNVYLCIY